MVDNSKLKCGKNCLVKVVSIDSFSFPFMPFSYCEVYSDVRKNLSLTLKMTFYYSDTMFLRILHKQLQNGVLLFHFPLQNMKLFT